MLCICFESVDVYWLWYKQLPGCMPSGKLRLLWRITFFLGTESFLHVFVECFCSLYVGEMTWGHSHSPQKTDWSPKAKLKPKSRSRTPEFLPGIGLGPGKLSLCCGKCLYFFVLVYRTYEKIQPVFFVQTLSLPMGILREAACHPSTVAFAQLPIKKKES